MFIDPTEAREGTRLPAQIVERASALPDLEARTGADILITPLSMPVGTDHLLRRHCQAGVLVQRKSGGDLVSSLTDGRLYRSLAKMLDWTDKPWLAFAGTIEARGQMGIVDGRPSLSYAALIGALDWWQLRGGYLTILSDDQALVGWVGHWLDRLRVLSEQPEKEIAREAQQKLALEGPTAILTALPGIGRERANALLDAAQNNPIRALVKLVAGVDKVPGIGKQTRSAVREWIGLGESDQVLVVDQDLVGRLGSYLIEGPGEWPERARLYADLMKGTGVPCTGHSGYNDWDEWYTQTEKEQNERAEQTTLPTESN